MLRAKRILSFVLVVLLTISIPCMAENDTELGTGGHPSLGPGTDTDVDTDIDIGGNPFLPGAGHNFVGKVIKEPTCTEDGLMTYTCQDDKCDAFYNELIPNKGGHKWSDWAVTDPGDCQHKIEQERICSVCDEVETRHTEFGAHPWGAWTLFKQGDCINKTIEKRICPLCDAEETRETEYGNHSWGEWKLLQKGDCKNKAVEVRVCSICGGEETRETVLGDHIWSDWEVIRESNCQTTLLEKRYCTVCLKEETREGGLGDHIWDETITKEPTCTENGAGTKHCTVCGLDETFEIEKTGHNPGVWRTIVAATCTEIGFAEQRCVVCSEQVSLRELPATGHKNEQEWTVTKEPTCTEAGEKVYACVDCGEFSEAVEIAPKGHQDIHVDTVPATCTEPGYRTYECLICGAKLPDVEIPATGHKAGKWKVVKNATTLAPGLRERHCTVCGELLETEVIAKLIGECDPFTDVNKKAWYHSAVDFVYNSKLMSGTSTTKFSPDVATTRGMFVTILGRLSGVDADKYNNAYFKDVKKSAYYFGYIEWARVCGIASGVGDHTFEPDRAITRQEMCKFIVAYAEHEQIKLVNKNAKAKFTDASKIASWASKYVYAAQRAGIVSGDAAGTFRPNDTAKRCEIAVLIMNFCNQYVK